MAKRAAKENQSSVDIVLEGARVMLAEKDYRGGREHPYAEGKAWLAGSEKPGDPNWA